MLTPGSFPWLVAHDVRLSWRRTTDMLRGMDRPARILVLVLAGVAFHLLAWPVAVIVVAAEAAGRGSLGFLGAVGGVTAFVCSWMMAQSLFAATRSLFAKGDLDLLLASPVSARAVLGSRAAAIAFETLTAVAIFIIPIANMCALLGGRHWLAIYPTLLGAALLASAIGLTVAVVLFHLVGPHRARIVTQVLAMICGVGLVLSIQVVSLLPEGLQTEVMAMLGADGKGTVVPSHALWLPVRAVLGDAPALLAWLVAGAIAFLLVTLLLGPRFAASVVEASGAAAATAKRPQRELGAARFRGTSAAALRRKEWRSLVRDSSVLSQMLLQIVYTLPLTIVLWKSQTGDAAAAIAIAPSLVVIASQISASLAWLAVSAESAPELLATSPLKRHEIERQKLKALAIPVMVLIALPLVVLAWLAPKAAAYTLVFCVSASLSTALLNLWHPMPANRRQLLRRHSQSKLVGLMEHAIALLWAVATVLTFANPIAAVVPIAVSCVILWLNAPGRRRAFGKARAVAEPVGEASPRPAA